MRSSDWSSDVCSSDLGCAVRFIADCQSGIWKKQFNKASFRTATSPLGNIAGDGAFAGYTSEELVIGGGGTCTTFNNGVPSTLITSLPMVKGQRFPYVPWGNAPLDGWHTACDGNVPYGGIATAKIGSASCRERVCQYGEIRGVA